MKILFKVKKIQDQVIVITGASSGIGLATSVLAAKKGAKVVMSSRNEDDLKDWVKKINELGGDAYAVKADVTSMEDLQFLRDEALARYGRIDTWVNNAGVGIFGYLMDADINEERALFETNFWGLRNACHQAIGAMSAHGGTIINLGSESSTAGYPILGMYSASKHAVKAFTEALRIELLDRNVPVAVSLIRPSAINTPFAEHALNRLISGEPSLGNDVYDPMLVAEAIIKCAENPKRDVYVGAPARKTALKDILLPERLDKELLKTIKEVCQGSPLTHHEIQEGLLHAPGKEGEIYGPFNQHSPH